MVDATKELIKDDFVETFVFAETLYSKKKSPQTMM